MKTHGGCREEVGFLIWCELGAGLNIRIVLVVQNELESILSASTFWKR